MLESLFINQRENLDLRFYCHFALLFRKYVRIVRTEASKVKLSSEMLTFERRLMRKDGESFEQADAEIF